MNSRRLFLVYFFILFLSSSAFAQKEYNVWYFGMGAGIDFNQGSSPVALFNSNMLSRESSTGICDAFGHLLFYTDGDTVWNSDHEVMENGIFSPFYNSESAAQGSMALPYPGSDSLYYLLTGISMESYSTNTYLRYSIIDISKNGGKGAVILKNEPLLQFQHGELFCVSQHANGFDYWISGIDSNHKFKSVRTVNGVMSPTVYYGNNELYKVDDILQFCKISPDSKYILSHWENNAQYKAQIYLHRFNNLDASLSNTIRIIPTLNGRPSAAEFSPNSRYLYMMADSGYYSRIFQFDLSTWDSTSIMNSRKIIAVFPRGLASNSGMQLGPDGKIYVFQSVVGSLSVINYPNENGTASGFVANAISLTPKKNYYGSPYYPAFQLVKQKLELGQDKLICEGDSVTLTASFSPGYKLKWSTGDTTNTIIARLPQQYIAMATKDATVLWDTVTVKWAKKFIVYLGSDTAFCGLFSHQLNAGTGAKSYLWSTTDTTYSIMVSKPDLYAVTVKDSNSCESGDTILIDQIVLDPIQLHLDSIDCDHVLLMHSAQQKGIQYTWNTGDTGVAIKVFNTGLYSLTATHPFCSLMQQIAVTRMPKPFTDIGKDTNLCHGELITLQANDGDGYLWSNGSVASFISVGTAGAYWVKVMRNGCSYTDTINLGNDCEVFIIYAPNAFTPNGDGVNDVFHLKGEHWEEVELSIYNRWGECIFNGIGKDPGWDGSYKGATCQSDVYFYLASVQGWEDGKMKVKYKTGSFTLLK